MAAAHMTLSGMFYLNSGRQFLLDKYETFAPLTILNDETTTWKYRVPKIHHRDNVITFQILPTQKSSIRTRE